MDTLPIYFKREISTNPLRESDNDLTNPLQSPSRLSFPVSVRSFDSTTSHAARPPIPPRPQQHVVAPTFARHEDVSQMNPSTTRTDRASKRGSVMLLQGPSGLVSGRGNTQLDWMRQFKPLTETDEPEEGETARGSSLSTALSTTDRAQPSSRPAIEPTQAGDTPMSCPPSLPPRRPPNLIRPSPSAGSSEPPLATQASQAASRASMALPPLPARSKSPSFRPSTTSSSATPTPACSTNPPPVLPTSSSTSSLNFGTSSFTAAFNRGLKQTGLKDRLVAGVGLTKEWGGKGKEKLQEFKQSSSAAINSNAHPRASTSLERGGSGGMTTSASSPQFDTFPSGTTPPNFRSSSSTSASTAASTIRLPAVIFDIPVPRVTGIAFGTPLPSLVSQTRLSSSLPPRPKSLSPITGDPCLLYLPAIAYRCLEYLSEWGLTEEGIYRIPGRSNMVQQLRALFDAGLGAEGRCDLRELHPSRLDPHAVASCFKNWLRELPEPLLSTKLESKVDQLTLDQLGYTASSSHFLSSTSNTTSTGNPSNPPSATTSPNPDQRVSSPQLVGATRAAPIKYLEDIAELFAEMPAENFYLLRAISYHLSLLASHSGTNKMTLTNLRLILSPTLRLSPGFLLILVAERETIFGGVNEDAKSRQAPHSNLVTPPLLSIPTFASTTTTTTTNKPRALNPRTPSPQPSLESEQQRSPLTPIADKFSAIPLAPAPAPRAVSSSEAAERPPPFAARNFGKEGEGDGTILAKPSRRIDPTEGFFPSRIDPDHQPHLRSVATPGFNTGVTVRREEEVSRAPRAEESGRQVETEGDHLRGNWTEGNRIRSADLKLALPEDLEDSFGLGFKFGNMNLSMASVQSQTDGTRHSVGSTQREGEGSFQDDDEGGIRRAMSVKDRCQQFSS